MATASSVKRSGGFPLRFDILDPTSRYFWIDFYFPWINFSHGKLRIFQKILQTELSNAVNDVLVQHLSLSLKEEKEKEQKKAKKNVSKAPNLLQDCLHNVAQIEIPWTQKFFENQLNVPIISTFGIDFPQANGLLVIRNEAEEEESGNRPMQAAGKLLAKDISEHAAIYDQAEDFLHVRYHPHSKHYVLDVAGFYVSPRRGLKPNIVTSVLRCPLSRSVQEAMAWKKWKETNPEILQPNKNQVPFKALQVERHACPLRMYYTRFHPSAPFLQDPVLSDEYQYFWVGWKTYQKFTGLDLLKSEPSPPLVPDLKKQVPVKFQLDGKLVPLAEYPTAIKGRRKEKNIKVYFGVASTWSRHSLFDPKHPDWIYQQKQQISSNKINWLQLTCPSIPQQKIEQSILNTPNPGAYKTKNSCMRGKTHSENTLKGWHKK